MPATFPSYSTSMMPAGSNPAVAALPLRDIHLPDPVIWWPLAPGWWLLLLCLLFLLLAGWGIRRLIQKGRRRRQLRRSVVAAFGIVRERYEKDGDDVWLVKELSQLLRRVGISLYPRSSVAALNDEAWLLFLDRLMDGTPFSTGVGSILAHGPYQMDVDNILDGQALLELCELWVKEAMQTEQGNKSDV